MICRLSLLCHRKQASAFFIIHGHTGVDYKGAMREVLAVSCFYDTLSESYCARAWLSIYRGCIRRRGHSHSTRVFGGIRGRYVLIVSKPCSLHLIELEVVIQRCFRRLLIIPSAIGAVSSFGPPKGTNTCPARHMKEAINQLCHIILRCCGLRGEYELRAEMKWLVFYSS